MAVQKGDPKSATRGMLRPYVPPTTVTTRSSVRAPSEAAEAVRELHDSDARTLQATPVSFSRGFPDATGRCSRAALGRLVSTAFLKKLLDT